MLYVAAITFALANYRSIGCRLAADEALSQVTLQLIKWNTNLLHGVALTHGHSVVLERIKVNGDAEWSTDLVLTTVTATNRT